MSKILDRINEPQDLKLLSLSELEILTKEVRDIIIRTVSKRGGHLSSNLGVVELTIALHFVFNAPEDKIIWDVGHQCYTHKILTGRKKIFSTLRQSGGLSGFPRKEESIYDTFNTGHSSTSISAALGMACARDIEGKSYLVVAVIGDGALTSGIAYEGLNNAGCLKKDLIVILNDNKMSISSSVGALSTYLTRLRTNPDYNRLREDFKRLMEKSPFLKEEATATIKRMERGIKSLVMPGSFFEELGFRYLGPINGHNLQELINILSRVKKLKGPIIVHVLTKKGKGYKFSEENPSLYHSAYPFNLSTGRIRKKEGKSWNEVFGETLTRLAKENNKIIAITAAMSEGTGLSQFKTEFPERFFDTGIAEEHMVTFAAGLASEGYRPVVTIYSTFLQRAYDQVLHDVALQDLPVVFVIDRAGIVGPDGPTHQGIFDIAYLRHLPNMIIMAPKDEIELQNMLYTAVNTKHPIAIRYPKERGLKGTKVKKFKHLKIGKSEVVQEGEGVAIFALGSMVKITEEACKLLKERKINPTLINARFVKPLDEDLILNLAKKTKKLITVEEGILKGGFGSVILELLHEETVDKYQIKRIGLPDEFIEQGERKGLLKKYGLNKEKIVKIVKEIVR